MYIYEYIYAYIYVFIYTKYILPVLFAGLKADFGVFERGNDSYPLSIKLRNNLRRFLHPILLVDEDSKHELSPYTTILPPFTDGVYEDEEGSLGDGECSLEEEECSLEEDFVAVSRNPAKA
jgi:hypothetical protein